MGVAAGRCLDWEHAASAVAHSRGWIGAEDWPALRRRVLCAAARGSARGTVECVAPDPARGAEPFAGSDR